MSSLRKGLLSYWKLDSTSGTSAIDELDNRNGTLQGSMDWTTGGKIKGGVSAPNAGNTSNRHRVDIGSWTASNSFSFNAWFKIDEPASNRVIFSNLVTTIEINAVGKIEARLRNGTLSEIGSTSEFNDDSWHMVTMVYESSVAKLYLDGVDRGNLNIGTSTSTSALNIGGENATDPRSWDGELDECIHILREMLEMR